MKIGLILLIFIAVSIIGFLANFGMFSSLNIEEKETGPFTLVYADLSGDYSKSAQLMDKVYYRLKEKENIETFKGIGIYFDDPKIVKKEDLRSQIGCILEEKDFSRIEELKSKEYSIQTLDKKMRIVVEIPFKSKFSIMVGIFRVYPAISKYMHEKGYKPVPAIEIYERNNKIYYMFDIEK